MNFIIDKKKALKWWGPRCDICNKNGYLIEIDNKGYSLCREHYEKELRKQKLKKICQTDFQKQ